MRICVDWGSTNFRAFLIEGAGAVVERRARGEMGVMKSFAGKSQGFDRFLAGEIDDWLARYPGAPILLCGAIGNREGWVETEYAEAPADLPALAQQIRWLSGEESGVLSPRRIGISPGLSLCREGGRCDMMRSEEVKSLGALLHLGRRGALICIPGTHCKWVRVEDSRIVDFDTVISGELYAQLAAGGSFAPLLRDNAAVADRDRAESFAAGLALAREGGSLFMDLWQVRSRTMVSSMPPACPQSFLSGILIGHEMRQARALYPGSREIVLLCESGPRQDSYRGALVEYGWTDIAAVGSEIAVCAGLTAMANIAEREV